MALAFESVVRSIAAKPYVERRPFQAAALRFGRDRDWVRERRTTSKFCELPEPDGGVDWQITSTAKREQHAREVVGAREWLDELDGVLAGADVVVAYNGFELDFPLLDESREREGRGPLAGVHLVDGLLLALSLWPPPPNNHRLADMARGLELDLDGFVLHEALSDYRLLAAVLLAAARSLRQQVDHDLVALFLAACEDSAAWNLVADLARLDLAGRQFDQREAAGLLGEQLEERSIRRRRRGDVPPAVPPLPGSVIGGDGRVDPHLLAETIQGHDLERRTAQGQMANLVAAWLGAGHGGLVEAPTGTGKSLVLLAGALDWVRGDPERRAIIATHTKQLQSQLARDVQSLVEADVETLRETADLVTGASNRLSVRGLVLELADSTDPTIRRRHETRPEYRDLLVYLAMRFATVRTVSERWLARSVDPVDVPMIFVANRSASAPSYGPSSHARPPSTPAWRTGKRSWTSLSGSPRAAPPPTGAVATGRESCSTPPSSTRSTCATATWSKRLTRSPSTCSLPCRSSSTSTCGGGQGTASEPCDQGRRRGDRPTHRRGCCSCRPTMAAVTTSKAVTSGAAPDLALLRAKRDEILRVASRHGASQLRVYGSVARGEARPTSDIDLLVTFESGRSLVDEVELQQELEALLGYRVDVAEEVHHAIRDHVLAEAVSL